MDNGKQHLGIFKTYGVNFLFNPAALDEGFNKDPLYANNPAAQNRGPWIKVLTTEQMRHKQPAMLLLTPSSASPHYLVAT